MPSPPSDDTALRVAYLVGESLARGLPELSTGQVLAAAISAAREAGDVPPKVAEYALSLATKLSIFPLEWAADLARKAIVSARDLADLPDELAAQAHPITGEVGFTADDALAVVDWLEHIGRAAVDIEHFYPDKDPTKMQWRGTTWDYSRDYDDGDWPTIVASCAREAREYIDAWRDEEMPVHLQIPGARLLFELFWMSENEFRSRRAPSQS